MRIIECSINNIKETFDGILLLGNFDGVHKGHASLVKEALDISDNVGVVLFKNHPLDVFEPNKKHYCLTSLQDKIRRFNILGVETFFIIDNSIDFYDHTKDEFIEFLKKIGSSRIVVGEDYTFGKAKSGTVSLLKEHFSVIAMPILKINDEKVGTRRIMGHIEKGEIETVNSLLGHEYEIKGKVVKGFGNGSKIGFPTANFEMTDNYLLPKDGVYKTIAYVRGIPHYALTNIGKNPTVGLLEQRVVESYIKGIKEDLYGEAIYISFISRIRDEKKFDSLEELKVQLEEDKKLI